MAGKATCKIVILLTFLLASVLMLPVGAQAWDADIWYFPTSAETGSSTTFRIDIENTQSRPLGIFRVDIQFEWQTGPNEYYHLFNSTEPYHIPVGDSKRFTTSVTIPSDIAQGTRYYVYIEVEAASINPNGSWDPSDRSVEYYVGDFDIDPSGYDGLFYSIICGMIAAVLGFLLVFIILTKRSKPQPPAYPYQQTAVYQPSQYRPPLYIPGAVTCPKCGSSVMGNKCNICGKKVRRT